MTQGALWSPLGRDVVRAAPTVGLAQPRPPVELACPASKMARAGRGSRWGGLRPGGTGRVGPGGTGQAGPSGTGQAGRGGRKWANRTGVSGDRRVLIVAVGVFWGKRALRRPVAALAMPLKCHMIVYMTETGESVVGAGVDAAESAINDDAVDGELVTSAVEVAEAWLAQLSDQIAVPASDVQDHLLDLWGVLDEGPAREEVERWLTETLRRNLYSVSDINERLETFLPVG
jgi:hypothetical protein